VLSWIVRYLDIEGIKGVASYAKESIADNTTMVDVNTGAILTPTITQVQDTNEDGTPKVDANGDPVMIDVTSYEGNYIGQYDWFNMVAETQQISVHDYDSPVRISSRLDIVPNIPQVPKNVNSNNKI